MIKEQDLLFEQIREWSPQWNVSCQGFDVAIVTERMIAKPRYRICWPDGSEEDFADRESVVDRLLEKIAYDKRAQP